MASKTIYALDSTALILPYTIGKRMPPVYRILLTLKDEIDPAVLRQAVRDLVPRFPYMYTRLRRGFFWDRLEDVSEYDVVEEDNGRLCRPFDYRGKLPLMRVVYKKNELGLEFTHFTADGNSGTVYLFSLAARYLELQGHAMEKSRLVLDCRDKPTRTELADAFRTAYAKPEKRIRQVVPPALQGPGKRQDGCLRATIAELPIDAMKALLNEKYGGCTITEYLAAVYSLAFLQLYEKDGRRKPVRLEVPCNLRQYWDTDTQRNFAGIANICVVPGRADYDFDDVLQLVRREMRENLSKEKMQAFIYQNLRYLKLLNAVPGFVKRAALSLGFALVAERIWPITSGITNLGYLRLPPSLAGHVLRYAAIMGRFGVNRIVCAAAGVNNTMAVAFSAANENTDIQDFCIDFWERDGLPVRLTEQADQAGSAARRGGTEVQ